MNWENIAGLMGTGAVITVFQWPWLKRWPKKEKTAYLSILAVCWVIGILLMMNPDMPGPSQFIDYTTKPLSDLMRS